MVSAGAWFGGYLVALAWDFGVVIAVAGTGIHTRPTWARSLIVLAILAAPFVWWRALRRRSAPVTRAFAGGLGFGAVMASIYAVLVALWITDLVAVYVFPLTHPVVIGLFFGGPALWFLWMSLLYSFASEAPRSDDGE